MTTTMGMELITTTKEVQLQRDQRRSHAVAMDMRKLRETLTLMLLCSMPLEI
tara:strand:+ start:421 stop:576 length:156 start_codon:yes stop_codon:yes gene_type:complete